VINFGIDTWRPSPQNVVWGLAPLIPHPLDNSFPSWHALFTAAFLIGCMRFFRNRWIVSFTILWGLLTAMARVTWGVHYPGDIIWGWIFGGLGAVILASIVNTSFFRVHIFAHIVRLASFFRL
jgi:undecaprenyl-diphosphatase